MKFYLIIALFLFGPSTAPAALQPADFAYGMPLSLKEDGAVYRLQMPVEVYQSVTRGDLGDIRVFNKSKAVVPHVLRRPKIKSEIHEQATSLPIFPLYRGQNQKGRDNISVQFERGEDGTLINIQSNGAAKQMPQTLYGYIIDASAHEENIDALDISWQAQEQSFIIHVSLEHSKDLTHWSTLVHRSTLARMNFKGHQIKKERINLLSKKAKYLRLSWPDGGVTMKVKGVVAVQRNGKEVRPHQWRALMGEPANPSDKAAEELSAYEYDSSAQLPVDRVRLRFVEKNTILEASLFSRSEPDSQWRFRKKSIFYDLSFDGNSLVQDTVSVGQASDRYWRVEMARDALGGNQNIPTVELGWLPHDLLFTARGHGPFMLAYGSARLGENAAENATPDLLSQVIGSKSPGLLKEATALPKIVLGGPETLMPAAPPLPWKKWFLWGVLVVGVGFIARMALSLGRGMNKEKT